MYQPRKNQFPPVEVSKFQKSARAFKTLINSATTILDEMDNSQSFAYQLKTLAQQGKKEEIQRLLREIGIKEDVKVSFNPDQIHIMLSPKGETGCCDLVMTLFW